MDTTHRFRRLRKNEAIRRMVREVHLSSSDLIMPIFVQEGSNRQTAIDALPGIYRYTLDRLTDHLDEIEQVKIPGIALFAAIPDSKKTSDCKEALNPNGLMQSAIALIKSQYPNLLIFSDVACDPYSSDGHDGLVVNEAVVNDKSVELLTKMAITHAEAGADFVAPSDMMDFRIAAIRDGLDRAGFNETGICSYAVKYASALYGPFREALQSAPKKGDKKTYQMDPANRYEAVKEVKQDIKEGADMIMIKPALAYLDIIRQIRDKIDQPIVAYHVSGEYAMIKAAAEKGWVNDTAVLEEVLWSIKRAGADCIVSYGALEWAKRQS